MAEYKPYDLGRRVRALDDWSTRLSAPALPGGDGKEPFLYLDFQYVVNAKSSNEKFRGIEIGVNLRKQGREGKIIFRPNIIQFGMICQAIRDAADGIIPDNMIKMETLSTFINGQKLPAPEMEFLVVIGNDDQGVFIGVSQKGRDNVKFYFTPPRMTQLRTRSGEVITNGYASRLAALGISKKWEEHIDHILRNCHMDDAELEKAKEEKKQAAGRAFAQRQGGGGGGYSGGGQQQQKPQYQSTAAAAAPAAAPGTTFDEDMPW